MTRHTRYSLVLALLASACGLFVPAARAQTPPAAPATTTTPAPPPPETADDDDDKLDPVEPDFVVVNLPTTLRLPVHKGNFHLTHRFDGNLRSGSFSDQLGSLFGVDVGATMAFEYRFGIMRHLQAIAQRTNRGRAIQFSAKYDGWHQNATMPVSLSAVVSVEGDNNFGANTGGAAKNYAPALGVVLSREIADRLAVYATPFWVHNTGTSGTADGNTGFLGLGTRIRITSSTNFIAEVSPRLGGFVGGDAEFGFGIDKRVGAHVFAITFTNGSPTTFRQLARGGLPENLHLGFNLTRKFF